MNNKQAWSRWHRFNDLGAKFIKRYPVDILPDPMIEHGYTEWRRGTGPMEEQHYKNVSDAVRRHNLGKPKSDDTKYKMRLAKLGVPKSEEHRKNMSMAWQRKRIEKYRQIMQDMAATSNDKKVGDSRL